MTYHTGEVIESQPDWLTAETYGKDNTRELHALVNQWITREVAQGARVCPFRSNGYVGFQAGRVRYGERQAAGLVQLSGDLARLYTHHVRPIWEHVTRFDAAVTVQFEEPYPTLGEESYAEHSAFYKAHPTSARPSHKGDADGGFTCYLGARTADYYLRIYNKQRECEETGDEDGAREYRHCWRYELECKGGIATPTTVDWLAHPADGSWCTGLLHGYITAHGGQPRFDYHDVPVVRRSFRRRSDALTRLDWFRKAVAPAVAQVLVSQDRATVLAALGLTDAPSE